MIYLRSHFYLFNNAVFATVEEGYVNLLFTAVYCLL